MRKNPAVGFTCHWLTELLCRLGDWPRAAFHAAECAELWDQLGLDATSPWPLHAKALVDAHLGNVDAARAAASRGLEIGEEYFRVKNRGVLGFLELALGNPADAAGNLQPAVRRLQEGQWRDPWGDLKPNAIEALIAVGELDEAADLLADLEDWALTVEAGAVEAACLRCRGLLWAAQGDPTGAFAAFEQALHEHEQLPTPFDRGRTLLALGALRRLKQRGAARESLEAALALFEELGAPLWAEKARTELAQLGGRRAQGGKLTPTETQIASLVAQGRTNQQVADALFISPKTVEWNLSKVYKKLHLHSRAELAAKLAKRPVQG